MLLQVFTLPQPFHLVDHGVSSCRGAKLGDLSEGTAQDLNERGTARGEKQSGDADDIDIIRTATWANYLPNGCPREDE